MFAALFATTFCTTSFRMRVFGIDVARGAGREMGFEHVLVAGSQVPMEPLKREGAKIEAVPVGDLVP